MSSNWKDRLFDFKADPPPTAWDAIAAGLDAQQQAFPEKLYNYAEQPPATAWPAIAAQLPAAAGAKVVPMRTRIVRFAAAAAVLLALAGIAYFTTTGNSAGETAAHTSNGSQQTATPDAPPPANRQVKHYNLPPQGTAATKAAAATKAGASHSPQHSAATAALRQPLTRRQDRTNLEVEPSFAAGLDVVPQEKNIINTDRADRYMIATSETGTPVRLPKKVYSAFACPEDDPRHQACELQLTLLQQKMSASLTTDFAHFLDLLKNLQEN